MVTLLFTSPIEAFAAVKSAIRLALQQVKERNKYTALGPVGAHPIRDYHVIVLDVPNAEHPTATKLVTLLEEVELVLVAGGSNA